MSHLSNIFSLGRLESDYAFVRDEMTCQCPLAQGNAYTLLLVRALSILHPVCISSNQSRPLLRTYRVLRTANLVL